MSAIIGVLVSSWPLNGLLLSVSRNAKNGTACKSVLGEQPDMNSTRVCVRKGNELTMASPYILYSEAAKNNKL